MFYQWPVAPINGPRQPVFGTLGEFRNRAGDGLTRLHGAADIGLGRQMQLDVYSPDTGLVVRETPSVSANPSAGGGGVRVGRFGLKHVLTVLADPGNTPEPIYVIDDITVFYLPAGGAANPSADADFKAGTLGDLPAGQARRPFIGFRRKGANDYERVRFWPRSVPIGRGVDPTDLHFIRYASASGPYNESDLRNPLEVVQYANDAKPVARDLLMTTHTNEGETRLSFTKAGRSAVFNRDEGGAHFKVHAFSPLQKWCGIYRLDYRIAAMAPAGENEAEVNPAGAAANDTGRLTTWHFTRLPSTNQSFLIVDADRSTFTRPVRIANYPNDAKITFYTLTHSKGVDNVTADNHFELEDPSKWPDGDYTITVWAQNIEESKGVDVAPDVNEVTYSADFRVETSQQGARRRVTVTRKFEQS
jgi:hypothetical protein